jgi:CRISPR-associated protein (TIGR02710 family)
MKALIVSVGTGVSPTKQAVENLANAIAYSIKHHNPDKIFFITTEQSQKTTLPKILQKIKPKKYEIVKIESPDNMQVIYEMLQRKFKQIRKNFDQVTVDYTSGTKAMTATLAILATTYEVSELSYITGKRRGGIVQAGTERIIPIRPYFATAEQRIKTAIQFFNKTQYAATITILNKIQKTIRDPEIINRIKPLLNLAQAYRLWDRFQHKKAFKILKKIKIEEINKNKQFLGQLVDKIEKNQEPEAFLIADLINNAARRAEEEKKYDDAVARLYRTIELIAQYRLKSKYGIITSQARLEQIPQELLKKWNVPTEKQRMKLALEKSYEVLNAKKDELGQKFMQDKKLRNLLSKRNTSILAHGLTPVTQETYKELGQKTVEYAEIVVKNLDYLLEGSEFVKWKE